MHLVNKHAPMCKIRVKAQNNPWFTPELARLLHDRDLAWAKARSTKSESDLLHFRKLRNLCTSQIKNAKSNFYLIETSKNLNNPVKFWKMVKSLSRVDMEISKIITKNNHLTTEKSVISDSLNEHFISFKL